MRKNDYKLLILEGMEQYLLRELKELVSKGELEVEILPKEEFDKVIDYLRGIQ